MVVAVCPEAELLRVLGKVIRIVHTVDTRSTSESSLVKDGCELGDKDGAGGFLLMPYCFIQTKVPGIMSLSICYLLTSILSHTYFTLVV